MCEESEKSLYVVADTASFTLDGIAEQKTTEDCAVL